MVLVVVAAAASLTAGHGGLTFPRPRNNFHGVDPSNYTSDGSAAAAYHTGGPCAGSECLWFNEGCYVGCSNCSLTMPAKGNYYGNVSCITPQEPTLPEKYRTWNIGNPSDAGDWTRYHPWRSPGKAPVADPCGIAGGYLKEQGGGGETPEGAKQGDKGSMLPPLSGPPTNWAAGDAVPVGWMVGANHGGGYIYSVCPKTQPLNEACFQNHVLPFWGDNHTIRYLDGRPDLQIPAIDVSEGTTPVGSSWRRNPIPACNCDQGFNCGGIHGNGYDKSYANNPAPVPSGFKCPTGTQFSVPFDYGYGQQIWNLRPNGNGKKNTDLSADVWVIMDHVMAPSTPGEYVLRWRWDVEQNPQIWTHCADVTVT